MICGACRQQIASFQAHRKECDKERGVWAKHLEAVDARKPGRARRLEREALHIPPTPMSEEAKVRLNSPEYKARAKAKAAEKAAYRKGIRATIRSMIAKKGRRP